MGSVATPPIERFWRHVDKQRDECWWWTGTTSGSKGRYGYFKVSTKATDHNVPAHRWLWEQLYGKLPADLEVDHRCRNKLCVNPNHLEPVTSLENMRRARLNVCRAGLHDLTIEENCRWDSQGRRRGCLQCWWDRYYERQRVKTR